MPAAPVRVADRGTASAHRSRRRPHPAGLGRGAPLAAEHPSRVHVRRGLLRQGRQGHRRRPRRHRAGRCAGRPATKSRGRTRRWASSRSPPASSLFGDRAFGWRFPAVLAGLVILACVYPLARRLRAYAVLGPRRPALRRGGHAGHRAVAHRHPGHLRRRLDGPLRPARLALRPGRSSAALAAALRGRRRTGRWPRSGREASLCWRPGSSSSPRGGATGGRPSPRRRASRSRRSPPSAAGRQPRAAAAEGARPAGRAPSATAPDAGASARPPDGVSPTASSRHCPRSALSCSCRRSSTSPATPSTSPTATRWPTGGSSSARCTSSGFTCRRSTAYASVAPSWIVDYRPVWYYFTGTTRVSRRRRHRQPLPVVGGDPRASRGARLGPACDAPRCSCPRPPSSSCCTCRGSRPRAPRSSTT